MSELLGHLQKKKKILQSHRVLIPINKTSPTFQTVFVQPAFRGHSQIKGHTQGQLTFSLVNQRGGFHYVCDFCFLKDLTQIYASYYGFNQSIKQNPWWCSLPDLFTFTQSSKILRHHLWVGKCFTSGANFGNAICILSSAFYIQAYLRLVCILIFSLLLIPPRSIWHVTFWTVQYVWCTRSNVPYVLFFSHLWISSHFLSWTLVFTWINIWIQKQDFEYIYFRMNTFVVINVCHNIMRQIHICVLKTC